WRDERGVNLLDGGAPFYGVYLAGDGAPIAVGPLEERFYAEFIDRLGLGEAAPPRLDPAEWPRLRAMIADRLATRSRSEWMAVFDGSDGCVTPVLSLSEAAGLAGPAHPHLAARGVFTDLHGVRQPAPAPRFSRTEVAPPALPPPLPGEHTDEVLAAWGVPGAAELLAEGVAVQAKPAH
ncbi:MAG TPA: CoA transferase, partial [Pilimelia sp.]|nr:CoA transferase [Pilimelia sp.]